MARRTRRLGPGSPAAGEVAAQDRKGADVPIVPMRSDRIWLSAESDETDAGRNEGSGARGVSKRG